MTAFDFVLCTWGDTCICVVFPFSWCDYSVAGVSFTLLYCNMLKCGPLAVDQYGVAVYVTPYPGYIMKYPESGASELQ